MGKNNYLNGVNINYTGYRINGIGASYRTAKTSGNDHKFTSDHGIQQFSFRITDKDGYTTHPDNKFHLATWNLLINCKKFPNGIYNNPFGIASESIDKYLDRKYAQKDHIEKLLNKHDIFSIKHDFVLIQEADFYFWGHHKVKSFKDDFNKMLKEKNYDVILPNNNGVKYQQLAIIFNKDKFKPVGEVTSPSGFEQKIPKLDSKGKEILDSLGHPDYLTKYRALGQDFKDLETGDKVHIVNMHLEMNVDYNEALRKYAQKNNISEDTHLIFGGDTNHVSYSKDIPHESHILHMINSGKATNIEKTDKGLTTKHPVSGKLTSHAKDYDGVMVHAAKASKIQTTIDACQTMEVDSSGNLNIRGHVPGRTMDKDVVYTATGDYYYPLSFLKDKISEFSSKGINYAKTLKYMIFEGDRELYRETEKSHKISKKAIPEALKAIPTYDEETIMKKLGYSEQEYKNLKAFADASGEEKVVDTDMGYTQFMRSNYGSDFDNFSFDTEGNKINLAGDDAESVTLGDSDEF